MSVDFEIALDRAASLLEWLKPAPVFIGGTVVPLFLDAFGRAQARPTKDVDCIVPEVLSYVAYAKLEERLRANGWEPDPEGPICRYRKEGGGTVDFLPEDPSVLGFAGRWYPDTVRSATLRRLVTGREILIPCASRLLACKLEAFFDRGLSDPMASQDLEDVVSLLDGCADLDARVAEAPFPLRRYLATELCRIIDDGALSQFLVAHLPRGGDEITRAERLRERIAGLVRSGDRDRD
ncbi:MAG: hypothetical protein PHU25_17935 [Deltaproteobacteria bacterium]|nr:hypothetical protein [Deltaproteobacteria bacterium]